MMMSFSVCAKSSTNVITLTAAAASSPEVGSSRKMTSGCFTSATAMLSRRFCPPDKPLMNSVPARVSAQLSRPSFLMMSLTCSRRAASGASM
mmetsp:Transcript_4291/g.16791  ORF Transcript_4291/g.16791 Transcript_4291/m.16791 type:complete len:92 (+) Transcript_4291:150-425(+)